MNKKRAIFIASLLLITVVGFSLGKAVNAAMANPGGQTDPLVSKSYIDSEVNRLQAQIDSLKAEVNKLKSNK